MKDIYVPEDHLLLDESLMLWRGKLIICQYIKRKRHKGEPYNDDIDLNQTEAIVSQFTYDFLDKGYSLFVKHYHNFVALAIYLEKSCAVREKATHMLRQKQKLMTFEFVWRQSKISKKTFFTEHLLTTAS